MTERVAWSKGGSRFRKRKGAPYSLLLSSGLEVGMNGSDRALQEAYDAAVSTLPERLRPLVAPMIESVMHNAREVGKAEGRAEVWSVIQRGKQPG